MLAVSKKTNRKHNRRALLVCLLVITLAYLLVGCTPSPSQQQAELEDLTFDQAPWDIEFNEAEIYRMTEHEFYFHQDTSYSKTMLAVTNYKVNKKFVLKALDERGVYYITKSCIIEIESVAIFDPTILRH